MYTPGLVTATRLKDWGLRGGINSKKLSHFHSEQDYQMISSPNIQLDQSMDYSHKDKLMANKELFDKN